jgi:hypothetical protein
MSARRQRRPQPRKGPRAAIAPTVTKALVIVVGVPPALVGQVEGWVETALAKPVRVIPIAASPNDNRPYRTTQIDQILSNVVAYAQRKRRAEQQPAPASILLLYVPGLDQEPLLTAFDFFVFPVPLATLSAFHEGRQLRHDPEEVCRAIDSVLTPGSAVMQTFDAVQQRVTALVDSEALQLPPINFHVARDRPIAEVFRAIRRGDQAWDAAVEGLEVQEFGNARIPHLHKGANRRAFQDGRGLVFLAAHPLARHGSDREAPDDEDLAETASDLLRGAFRFGCPLGKGFHHDVQLEGDRRLDAIVFQCARKGPRRSKHTYVNIYPNDVVRGKKLAAP